MSNFAPEQCHDPLLAAAPRTLRFSPEAPLAPWQASVRQTLSQLHGPMPPRCDLNLRVEGQWEREGFREIRYLFASEPNADVPCHLLLPTGATTPLPLVICLQGHSTGMHISLGQPKNQGDAETIAGDRDYALQAVRHGYAALALEQRCFGERADRRPNAERWRTTCHHAAMVALLLGRPMIGQRVWDVMRAIDSLAHFPEIDLRRIACMGNSGGGTVTYHAAAMDPRISIAMPSCAVCTYRHSIGVIDHCEDNYLPNAASFFDMADLAGAIAPRPLIVVAGRTDEIFPFQGVEESFRDIQSIYRSAATHHREPSIEHRCRLVIGPAGHRFYAQEAWPVFRELSGW